MFTLSLCYISFLVAEGKAGYPKMMSVGLHCRLSRPARVAAIQEFLDYAKSYGNTVWICTREQIANHWYDNHLPRGSGTPIEANNIRSSSSFTGTGVGVGVGVGVGMSSGSGQSSVNRFSFLGNLTVPRDSVTASAGTPRDAEMDSDGDII